MDRRKNLDFRLAIADFGFVLSEVSENFGTGWSQEVGRILDWRLAISDLCCQKYLRILEQVGT